MKKSIHVFDTVHDLSLFFGQLIVSKMQDKGADQAFSIVLSGGSTPKAVFAYLASHFGEQIDWKNIQIFWGDERCVPPESEESNYKMAKESLLDAVGIPSESIFRIRGEATEPAEEAERYAELVRQKVPAPDGIPQFDLLMLGLGDDGHTASIFPGNLSLFESEELFVVAEHPQSKQKRISATGGLINQASTVVFLSTGEAKAEMVARILEDEEGSAALPAAHVQPQSGELLWLLDQGSAAHLAGRSV